MVRSSEIAKIIRLKYQTIRPYLNERGRRLWAATEAAAIGRGGVSLVCQATGLSSATLARGVKELNNPSSIEKGRVRKKGGGRKKATVKQEGLAEAIDKLVDPTAKGDPENPLRWTSKSTRKIEQALKKLGYQTSYRTVARILQELGFSLQANRKSLEGTSHKDRDAQFNHINDSIRKMHRSNQPTISVDAKKKENLGQYKNAGQEYYQKGKPAKVNTHDFPDARLGKVVPYGVYDIGENKGWVSIGIGADTAQFAVNTIRTWWYKKGSTLYPKASSLTITADCGGSNGYRVRLWKLELQKLANEIELEIQVHHFPPGTSKWNKIEHRLFSYISKNWRGRPLVDQETVVNLISNTRTEQGLEVHAVLDNNEYKKGRKISDPEMANINIHGNSFHPEWNYTIRPHRQK